VCIGFWVYRRAMAVILLDRVTGRDKLPLKENAPSHRSPPLPLVAPVGGSLPTVVFGSQFFTSWLSNSQSIVLSGRSHSSMDAPPCRRLWPHGTGSLALPDEPPRPRGSYVTPQRGAPPLQESRQTPTRTATCPRGAHGNNSSL
jgi:hypothetical protein